MFGPAQALLGATFVFDVRFFRPDLDPDGIVVDIGRATQVLGAVLATINYRNLDDLPAFAGQNTTTEFLARWVHGELSAAVRDGRLGAHAGGITAIRVGIEESHVARAAYQAPVA